MSALTTPEHRAALARDILRNHGCLHPHDVGNGTTVRCGSRFVEKCPSCADIYANDWKAILRSGLDAPKDAPACAFFFWTLTAPSFGKIHAVPSDNRKKERRRCTCGKKHTANDHHLRGVPVDLDSYDYAGTVRFNRDIGRLWNATTTLLRNRYPGSAWASVREWQRRGTLHMHALIRIPLHELGPGGPVAVERELKRITRRVTTSGMSHPTERSHRIRWGKEADTTHLDTTDAHATNRRIWYVGKALGYTAKNLAAGYDNDSMQGPAAAHLARLHTAAAEMPCGSDCDGEQTCPHRFVAPLRAFDPEKAPPGYRHKNLGASAHVMSISRPKTTVDPRTGEITTDRYGWSYTGLTREQQRQERSTWVQEQLDLGEWPTAATPKIVTEYIRDAHRFLLEAMGQAIRPRPAP